MTIGKRSRNQRGQELVEFAVLMLLLVFIFLGSFITGMNLIRSIQANQTCRDLTNMYIHGADFSTYGMQQMAQRLAHGLHLEIGSSFNGQRASNTGNAGRVLVTVSTVMYVGGPSEPNCVSVGSENCINHDSFVFTQRIQFGNGTLAATKPSSLGDPSTGLISNAGILQQPVTDGGARLPTAAQSRMLRLWRTPLMDGQMTYVVEFYAQSPDLNLGAFTGGGVYARYFF